MVDERKAYKEANPVRADRDERPSGPGGLRENAGGALPENRGDDPADVDRDRGKPGPGQQAGRAPDREANTVETADDA